RPATPRPFAAGEGGPPPAPPRLSIILPLRDHRGFGLRCVTSWVRHQRAASDLFELIVLGDGTEPALESAVRDLLRPHDQFIRFPTQNELHQYDVGARAA